VLEEKRETVWEATAHLLHALRREQLVSSAAAVAALTECAEVLGDVAIDVPKAPRALAVLLAHGIVGDVATTVTTQKQSTRYATVSEVVTLLLPSVDTPANKSVCNEHVARAGLGAAVLARTLQVALQLGGGSEQSRIVQQCAKLDVQPLIAAAFWSDAARKALPAAARTALFYVLGECVAAAPNAVVLARLGAYLDGNVAQFNALRAPAAPSIDGDKLRELKLSELLSATQCAAMADVPGDALSAKLLLRAVFVALLAHSELAGAAGGAGGMHFGKVQAAAASLSAEQYVTRLEQHRDSLLALAKESLQFVYGLQQFCFARDFPLVDGGGEPLMLVLMRWLVEHDIVTVHSLHRWRTAASGDDGKLAALKQTEGWIDKRLEGVSLSSSAGGD
jgi:hypothetical protein